MHKFNLRRFEHITRRHFLTRTSGCAALTSTSLLAALLNLRLTRSALAAVREVTGYKALVCLFQHGGNDSFNMLTPYEPKEYDDYAAVRGNLALARESLWPIMDSRSGRQFGLHPGMPEVYNLYNQQQLAFVANVGSLIAPTTVGDYHDGVNLPLGLFSHSDQQRHWQTSVPQSRQQITGWAGRMADCLTDAANSNPNISMNIAFGHLNIMQTGDDVFPYVVDTDGATLLEGYGSTSTLDRMLTRITDSLLEQTYTNLLERTHASMRRNAIDVATEFHNAIAGVQLSTPFPATSLGRQLQMVASIIAARQTLGHRRQIFFVERGGWDHHDGVLEHQASMLPELSQALQAFYNATVELGVANNVVSFTISDFARTLTSNGNGSDHAWGGNHIVMGGRVRGGRLHGQYPESLALHNALDVGRGRLVPTLSVDEYSADLALWFGLQNDPDLEMVLPNIRNFYATGATARPVGLLR